MQTDKLKATPNDCTVQNPDNIQEKILRLINHPVAKMRLKLFLSPSSDLGEIHYIELSTDVSHYLLAQACGKRIYSIYLRESIDHDLVSSKTHDFSHLVPLELKNLILVTWKSIKNSYHIWYCFEYLQHWYLPCIASLTLQKFIIRRRTIEQYWSSLKYVDWRIIGGL